MSRNYQDPIKIFTAKATTGASQAYLVEDFRHVIMALGPSADANMTVQFVGSIQDAIPDFSAAASASNLWDYVQAKDLEDASTLDGDVGVVYTGTGTVRQAEINTNGLKWVGVVISARSAGSTDVTMMPFNDTN